MSGSMRGWGHTAMWMRYCGTAGNPGGYREYKPLPVMVGTGLLTKTARRDLWGNRCYYCDGSMIRSTST